MDNKSEQKNSCEEEMRNIIEEARVILPGVQALFRFQTIAVFNDRFADLPSYATLCHLIGLGMVVVAIALVMTPAIYYRVVGPDNIYHNTSIKRSSLDAALRHGTAGLAAWRSICSPSSFVRPSHLQASIFGAFATFVILTGLWFAFPWFERRRVRRQV